MKTNLSPLMMAVIMDNLVIIDAIIEKFKTLTNSDGFSMKASLEATEENKWTALHFAAGKTTLFTHLFRAYVQAGIKITELRNNFRGTPIDLNLMTKTSLPKTVISASSASQVFYRHFENEEGISVSSMDSLNLCQQTGLKEYRDFVLLEAANDLTSIYRPEDPSLDVCVELLTKEVELQIPSWERCAPKLYIQRTLDSIGHDQLFGLIAGQSFSKGDIISIYTGRSVRNASCNNASFISRIESSRIHNYQMDTICAREVGSASRFANHGFPNVGFISTSYRGFSTPFMVAFRPIKEKEEIIYNYGTNLSDLLFEQPLSLIGAEEMRLTLAEFGSLVNFATQTERLLETINKDNITDVLLEIVYRQSQLYYILNTPVALIDLSLRGLIDIEEILRFIPIDLINKTGNNKKETQIYSVFSAWLKTHLTRQHFVLLTIAVAIQEFQQATQHRVEYRDWILSKIGSLSALQLLKAMEWMDQESIDLNDLNDRISHNSYLEDETCPLSEKRQAQSLAKAFRYMSNPEYNALQYIRINETNLDPNTQYTLSLMKTASHIYLSSFN